MVVEDTGEAIRAAQGMIGGGFIDGESPFCTTALIGVGAVAVALFIASNRKARRGAGKFALVASTAPAMEETKVEERIAVGE